MENDALQETMAPVDEALAIELSESAEPPAGSRILPFSFAKRHGVLIREMQ